MAKRQPSSGRRAVAGRQSARPPVPPRWLPWVPVCAAVILYGTGLNNDMVGLDDHSATVDNPAVRDGRFFSGFNLGMYAPLTWLGYALAQALGGGAPFWYHLLSLIVHAVNVYLVYRFFLQLEASPVGSAVMAFIFAVHPIQVEAVAWIAGFSTPLYTLFYLLACHRFLDFRASAADWRSYAWALFFFVLACLAKSAAVTLPLSLLVLDVWKGSVLPWRRRLLQYAPFGAIALGFGLLTIYSRQQAMLQTEVFTDPISPWERIFVLCYTPLFYWVKMLLPLQLNVYYSFDKVNGQFPWPYYAAPAVLAVLLWTIWRYRHRALWAWQGVLWYFAAIAVMLPFYSLGTFEMRADHYNYLAIIGFSWVLVGGWSALLRRFPNAFTLRATFLWLPALFFLSLQQIRTWKDTISVITHAIDNGYTQNGLLYLGRAKAWGQQGKLQKALDDFDKALQVNPNIAEVYKYRGALLGIAKRFDESLRDLSAYLEKHPQDAETWYNRALTLVNLERYKEALSDLDRTLELDPNFTRAYRARGNVRKQLGDEAGAAADFAEYEKRTGFSAQQ